MAVPTPAPQQSDHDPAQAITPAHPAPVGHLESPSDATTNTSRVMLFVILAIIIGSIAIFLIIRPSPPQ